MNLKHLIKIVSTISISLTALAISLSVKSLNDEANKSEDIKQDKEKEKK